MTKLRPILARAVRLTLRRIGAHLIAYFAVLGLFVGYAGSGADPAVLAMCALFAVFGALGRDTYLRRSSRRTIIVGCRACGWNQEIEDSDQVGPALTHHVEFDCPVFARMRSDG